MASLAASAERDAAWGRWIPRAVLALVVLRGALVLALGDVFFYGDELEKGAAGKALLDGLGSALGHHRLAYHYYEGGGFAVALLDALAFRLVGQNLLALKLVALGFDVAILLAGVSLARRAFGARAAAVYALFHVLAPESVQKNALLALGIHWQALLFCLLVLDRAGRIALEGDARRANWIAAGLAGGLGIYFNWGVAPVVAYAALAVLVLRPRALASRGALLGVAAFAAGLAPLLWMASRVGLQVLDIHGAGLIGRAPDRPLVPELGAFLASIFAGREPLDLLSVLLVPLLPALGLAALILPRGDGSAPQETSSRRWALYLAGYSALFAALYLASDFTVGAVAHYFQFHRLSQPWMLGTLLAAGGLASLAARGGAARLAALVLGGLLAAGGLRGTLLAIARGNTVDFARNLAILTRTKGYRYDEYVPKIWGHLEGTDGERVNALRGFDEPSELLQYTLAVHLFAPGHLGLAEVRARAAELGFDECDALVALGAAWRERYGGEIPERRAAVLAEEAVAEDVRPLVEESFGRFGLGFLVTEDRLREELALGLAHDFPAEYFHGLGYRLFSARGDRELAGYWRQTRSPCFVDHDRALGFIGAADPRVAPWLLEGFHGAVADYWLR